MRTMWRFEPKDLAPAAVGLAALLGLALLLFPRRGGLGSVAGVEPDVSGTKAMRARDAGLLQRVLVSKEVEAPFSFRLVYEGTKVFPAERVRLFREGEESMLERKGGLFSARFGAFAIHPVPGGARFVPRTVRLARGSVQAVPVRPLYRVLFMAESLPPGERASVSIFRDSKSLREGYERLLARGGDPGPFRSLLLKEVEIGARGGMNLSDVSPCAPLQAE